VLFHVTKGGQASPGTVIDNTPDVKRMTLYYPNHSNTVYLGSPIKTFSLFGTVRTLILSLSLSPSPTHAGNVQFQETVADLLRWDFLPFDLVSQVLTMYIRCATLFLLFSGIIEWFTVHMIPGTLSSQLWRCKYQPCAITSMKHCPRLADKSFTMPYESMVPPRLEPFVA
jgi:hypothetical protein